MTEADKLWYFRHQAELRAIEMLQASVASFWKRDWPWLAAYSEHLAEAANDVVYLQYRLDNMPVEIGD